MSTASTVRKNCREPTCTKNTTKFLTCGGCRQARYCDRICQKKHWKAHKQECKDCVEKGSKLYHEEGHWVHKSELKDRAVNYSVHDPVNEMQLIQAWAATAPPRLTKLASTPEAAMARLGITPDFLHGLTIGDWDGVDARMMQGFKKTKAKNKSPLQRGDYVQILPGNHVNFQMVGQQGTLLEYFKKDRKWGLELDSGDKVMILAKNLQKI